MLGDPAHWEFAFGSRIRYKPHPNTDPLVRGQWRKVQVAAFQSGLVDITIKNRETYFQAGPVP